MNTRPRPKLPSNCTSSSGAMFSRWNEWVCFPSSMKTLTLVASSPVRLMIDGPDLSNQSGRYAARLSARMPKTSATAADTRETAHAIQPHHSISTLHWSLIAALVVLSLFTVAGSPSSTGAR